MRALSRKKAPRESLLRNLATSLVLYERIETTEAKAKEVKPIVEHLIAIAKKNDLAARRRLLGYFFDKNATDKVIEVLVPRYAKIQSGFIKSYRKGVRLGDNAMIMILELQPARSASSTADAGGKEKEKIVSEETKSETKDIKSEVKDIKKVEGKDGNKAKSAKAPKFESATKAGTKGKTTKSTKTK